MPRSTSAPCPRADALGDHGSAEAFFKAARGGTRAKRAFTRRSRRWSRRKTTRSRSDFGDRPRLADDDDDETMADVVGLTLLWQEAWGRAWPEEHRTLRVSSEDFHYSVLTRTVDIPAHLGYDVDEGPRTLGLPALVVLGEYAFVWDALVVQRERFFSEEPGTTVILTGHPGTGSSLALVVEFNS